jgi:threonine/homoserine/homoserine lactone efflux protein
MTFAIILKGVLTGLFLSIIVGATFFTVMETVMRRGPVAAILLNAGVWMSDIGCIFVAFFSAKELMAPLPNTIFVKLIAAAAFLFFGITYFLRKPTKTIKPLGGGGVIVLIVKGFAINTLNPGVLAFWLATMTMVVSTLKLVGVQILGFFASTIITVMVFDVLKIIFSSKLRKVITEAIMTKMFRITGIILMAFGIYVMIKAFWS